MEEWEFAVGIAGLLIAFVGFLWRVTSTNNAKNEKIHQRITRESEKAEDRVKEVEDKLHGDRVKVAKEYVSHSHLEINVMKPMEKGFDELKELIKRHN